MKNNLAIIGAGGHGKVVLEAARRSSLFKKIVFVDERADTLKKVCGAAVVGGDNAILDLVNDFLFIVAIGNNQIRKKKSDFIKEAGGMLATVVHPAAIVSEYSEIGPGTVVFANAVINPDVKIGAGVIINTSAVIEHDCQVADFSHIAPGAVMTGGSTFGAMGLLGTLSALLPQVHVGANSIVGAGAVVNKSWQGNVVLTGIPAKPIK